YRLREQAAAAGMSNRVVVHAVCLEQLPSVFGRAAAVIAPSRTGSSPDPVPEALAAGAPVVATAIGSHPTWIREGRTGWLVPPRAPVALAARLAQVVDNPAGAKKVGENAQKAALELTAPRAIAQELARCYAAISRVPAQPRTRASTFPLRDDCSGPDICTIAPSMTPPRDTRVLLVGDYPPPNGGIATHVEELFRALRARGATCLVLDIGKGQLPAQGVIPAGS